MNSLQPFQSSASALPGHFTSEQMAQVLRDFMAGFAPSSRITMRYALRRIADDLGFNGSEVTKVEHVPWYSIRAAAVSELLFVWRDQLEVGTIRLYMHALRGVARACFIRGMMPADEFALLSQVRLPRGRNKVGRGRALEQQYKAALLSDCMNDERIQGVRDAALIALLFGSGIRRAEAASLLDENLDIDEGELKVRVKGGDYVVRYLAAWTIPYLQAWRDVRRSNELHRGPFFSRIWKGGKVTNTAMQGRSLFYLLEERSKRAGLPFLVRPHDARRTVGTEMLSTHGELIAQKVLGHADLSTTRIYDKRSDEVVKRIFSNWV
ncbi:tyrosine-type recombinase/integrase [Stutzerimonas stutzeri]|uniref:tyrosine-type recombinase/integrase n=1 Tax=Stutzerimonas stutzeri TaxID=316 RepID=UPI00265D5913|nr:tyrosine-type recombinase/integrase [Stutzerimonas stutzeri]MCF6783706.1 tyrosine-type recombinase/integrase [Stutzerimonas stutzeri]